VSSEHEFDHIDWIRERVAAHSRLDVGIGDDTASIRFPSAADCLVTVDMLMEGVHFTLPPATPKAIGHKALAVNLSDIAAMAGRPLAATVSLALPRSRGIEFARELHRGIHETADKFGVALAGGDTNVWDGPLVISVNVLGEATGNGPVLRSGAQVGDWLLVTGTLGGSLAGRHLTFRPRINEALKLNERAHLHAMIDLSDGLASDLYHILDESHAGAVLYANRIPISEAARASAVEKTPIQQAIGDGEDFELLFAVVPDDARALLADPPFDTQLTHVGEVVAGSSCVIEHNDGTSQKLPRSGWQHQF